MVLPMMVRCLKRGTGTALIKVGTASLICCATIANTNPVNAQPTFTQGQVIPGLPVNSIYSIAIDAADLDGDGDPDLVVGEMETHKVNWYRNDSGTFSNPMPVIDIFHYPIDLKLADLDSDGDPDLVCFSTGIGNRISLFRNVGGPGIFGPEEIILDSANAGYDPVVTDFNSDGATDILYKSVFGLLWLENLGSGTFSDPDTLINGFTIGMEAGDMDNDGQPDILMAGIGDSLKLYANAGNGNLENPVVLAHFDKEVYHILAHDFSGDGLNDIVAAGFAPSFVSYLENLQGNAFAPAVDCNVNASYAGPLEIFDADLDGDDDLLMRSPATATIAWVENQGGDISASVPIIISDTITVQDIEPADVDTDGDLDVIAVDDERGAVVVYMNENPAGIEPVSGQNRFAVFPNPSTGLVNITSSEKSFHLEVFNAAGQRIFQYENAVQVDMAALPTGLYSFVLTTPGSVEVQKVVRN